MEYLMIWTAAISTPLLTVSSLPDIGEWLSLSSFIRLASRKECHFVTHANPYDLNSCQEKVKLVSWSYGREKGLFHDLSNVAALHKQYPNGHLKAAKLYDFKNIYPI